MGSRMNKSARKTGAPRVRQPDTHTAAVREAYESGLAAWARANGFSTPDGSPMIHSASQRRRVERAMQRANDSVIRGSPLDAEAYRWARDQQGYTGTWAEWLAMPLGDRQAYEDGAARGDTPRRVVPLSTA